MESRKMVLITICRAEMETHVEKRLVDTVREGEGETN